MNDFKWNIGPEDHVIARVKYHADQSVERSGVDPPNRAGLTRAVWSRKPARLDFYALGAVERIMARLAVGVKRPPKGAADERFRNIRARIVASSH
jgi:hypothetical protein